MPHNQRFLIYLLLFIFFSCATKHTRYRLPDEKNEAIKLTQDHDGYTSYFMLGNAGTGDKEPNVELLKALGQYTSKNASEQDYLFFLGDNLKLEKSAHNAYLDPQVKLAQGFPGQFIMIPGDREWHDKSPGDIEDLEDKIEEIFGQDNQFLPENACPLEEVDVDDNTHIIVVDSQWYIEDWSKKKKFNDKCQIKTREQFLFRLGDAVRKARHKNILLLMHHPLYTNGIYGGEISGEAAYRPSAQNLFIPGAGFLYSFIRSQGGISKQDQFNPLMTQLMNEIKTITDQAPQVFVLSAHEQSLQYIEHDGLRQIISGTAGDQEAARLGKDGYFLSGKPGFVELRIYDDQSSEVIYHLLKNNELKPAYRHVAFERLKSYNVDSLPTTFEKTYTASVYPPEDVKVKPSYEKLWGKHYRYLYGIEVEAPVGLIDTLYGGLEIERAGGGHQTQSLRLIGKDDREYNMRAIAKDPYSFLHSAGYDDLDAKKYFSATLPVDLIEDFYTAAHPYGAFVIPRLAGAANLNHTHPKLFYIPRQKALGDFNDIHGDRLYMIVEKPDSDFNDTHMFGFNEDVESTADLFEKIRGDEENYVDEASYIRARIFDMLVGDWDRHEDQWRWAQLENEKEEGDNSIFVAIPRDRDQVFANFDGGFLETLQKVMAGPRQFGKYGPDIQYIKEFSQSAIKLDRALVQKSDRKAWLSQVDSIQENITREVVQKAFAEMPMEAQDDTWKGIQEDLLSRKQNLHDIVERYYDHFIKFQTLTGTDMGDEFTIDRLDNGDTRIVARRIKKDSSGVLFDRVFHEGETHEIWIYGLDDDDVFIARGDAGSKIKIVISGGLGDDTYDLENGNNITVYDQRSGDNTIMNRGGARFRINDTYENHIYDTEREPDVTKEFEIDLSYNPDLGFIPRILIGKQKLGFERNPFTSLYTIEAKYHSLTQALDLNGELHFAHIFPDWNLKVNGRLTSNNYAENFFGFGNETGELQDFDANRIFMQRYNAGASLYYAGEYGSSFEAGILYEGLEPDASAALDYEGEGRVNRYGKVHAQYRYHSVDDELYPTRGMYFNAKGFYADELASSQSVLGADQQLTFWNAIDNPRNLVIKTSAEAQLRFGDGIPFFQAARLGADSGLRGYRLYRFTGQNSLVGNIDLNYKFKPLKTRIFPLRISGFVGYDMGRVWMEDESSNTWHTGYGGGLNLGMSGIFNSGIQYFTSDEGGRLSFKFAVGF